MPAIEKHKINTRFEKAYIRARSSEKRLLSIDQIKQLPYLTNHPLSEEWLLRQKSTERFLQYVQKQKVQYVLDLGCGNGWLTNRLSPLVEQVTAIDVNLTELKQATEVLTSTKNINLKCCDIFSTKIAERFDLIVVNGTIQYFPDFKALIERLFVLLKHNGEIHILDSPFYKPQNIKNAKKRSDDYYDSIAMPDMKPFYHHHSWEDLGNFNYQVLYNPNTLLQKIKNKFAAKDSPFPWIIITQS